MLFYLVTSYSPFFRISQINFYTNVWPQKGNLGISFNHTLLNFGLWAQNLRLGIVMKTSYETRVSRMGLGSFVDINIFGKNVILFSYFIFSIFSNLSNQYLHKCLTPKRKLGNFVQPYSFKFRALLWMYCITPFLYTEWPKCPGVDVRLVRGRGYRGCCWGYWEIKHGFLW